MALHERKLRPLDHLKFRVMIKTTGKRINWYMRLPPRRVLNVLICKLHWEALFQRGRNERLCTSLF